MTHDVGRALSEKLEVMKNIYIARATGEGSVSDEEYSDLRAELIAHPILKARIPSFVRTCRSLGEFWGFIKPKFSTYHERRTYICQEFDPVLTFAECANQTPADESLSAGLKQSAAEQIHAVWSKALDRRSEDPEGAITAARTLLETVCKHLLDELGETYDDKADLPKLYSLVAAKLTLAPSQHTEQVFKQILGGCHSVVEGLGALRNRLSDAHGKGKAGVRPHSRHAHLAVNLAGSVAMFLVETAQAKVAAERKA